MTKRLNIFCLAFNTISMTEGALELFAENLKHSNYPMASKTLFDPHFPGVSREELKALAFKHGWDYCDMQRNHGVHLGWQFAINKLGLSDGDVLVGVDPDGRPQQHGWCDAIMDVFNAAPECYYVGLNQPFPNPPLRFKRSIGGRDIYYYPQLCAWPLGGFDIGWMKRINGPLQGHSQYAWLEHSTSAACAPLGGQFYMLADFFDHHLQSTDTRYTAWKHACVNNQTHLDFASWLAMLDGNV